MTAEEHPLIPFLPSNAHLMMLGSFPPSKKRWSIDFYYPNWQNDMWRIVGYLFFGDKQYFCLQDEKKYNKDLLVSFLIQTGFALSDTAQSVVRLKDNASDKFLQIVKPMDLASHLSKMPLCKVVVVTGEKAADEFCSIFTDCSKPAVGEFSAFDFNGRSMHLFRMPSSSRAYPRSIEWKAEFYRKAFVDAGIL